MADSKEELKSLLMKVKEESEKVGLKFNKQNTKIMHWSHNLMANRWKTMETVRQFILGDSKITAGGEYSHEIKRHLLLGRKALMKLDQHIKKQRHHFSDKGPSCESYGSSSSHV